MAASGVCPNDTTTFFQRCYQKLMIFVLKDDNSRTDLNLLLDELIALDCSSVKVSNESGNHLLRKLCSLVPVKQERLVTKVCHFIHNSVKYKLVSPLHAETIKQLADYIIKALKQCPEWALPDILQALGILLEDYCEPFFQYQDILVGTPGLLIQILETTPADVGAIGEAVHCLRCLAVRTTDKDGLSSCHIMACFTSLLNLLHNVAKMSFHQNVLCKILVNTLMAIHSILLNTRVDLEPHLGALLAVVKTYIFHGLGRQTTIPSQLFPTITTAGDAKTSQSLSSTDRTEPLRSESSTSDAKPRSKKTRRKKGSKTEENTSTDSPGIEKSPDKTENVFSTDLSSRLESVSLQPSWARVTSSESEFSDTEAGQTARYHSLSAKVRLSASNCLAAICKVSDKKSMFGYWSYFIPDSPGAGNSPQVQTLFTSILKDPSPKCRMAALVALTAMLDGTKQFLAAAEESSTVRTAFTSLSTMLGSMIRELHRALLQALVVENYNLTLTQLIKCLATLLVNVPYHRLQPGLLTRVVKQIRHFLGHRDSNVRVACLTCLGALVSHQPPLLEVYHIIQAPSPPTGITSITFARTTAAAVTTTCLSLPPSDNFSVSSDSGFNSHSTASPASLVSEETKNGAGMTLSNPASGMVPEEPSGATPLLAGSPGCQTPIFTDQILQAQAHETSWLIKHCIRNILPHQNSGGDGNSSGLEPLPVRLESLQVLATLTKGYFPVVRNCVGLIEDLIRKCLEDADPTVKLHGCKVLDELVQAVLRDIQDSQKTAIQAQAFTVPQALALWESVLNGSLIQILQHTTHNPVRASACDCVSNIGETVFSLLSRDTQQFCLKIMLQLTSYDDRLVVSAAVRVLGVYVLYQCLAKDVTFMAEAADAILKCMRVPSINVKIKAAWSLANLCDALVMNKDKGASEFMDQFPDLLLSTLLTTATTAVQDSDKVKCNAVRAVGNIMRYLPARILGKSHVADAVSQSVKVLIKTMNSGPMKVRWNSCYAIANMFRNSLLMSGDTPWLLELLVEVCKVVKDSKNFKVRINAALALSIPAERLHYGDVHLYIQVWDSLVNALRSADDITDFAEFRYKDSLSEQLCIAVLHMISLAEQVDIIALLPCLQTSASILQTHMQKLVMQKPSVKSTALKAVVQRLNILGAQDVSGDVGAEHVSGDVFVGLKLLREICLLEDEIEELTHTQKTTFKQIYD